MAPVPWFPSVVAASGRYKTFAQVPESEQVRGLQVFHPRYPVIPKVSWRISPRLMQLGSRKLVRELHMKQNFSLIDAHFMYPDGVAATFLGQQLNIPVCITARGSDVNLMSKYHLPRRYIQWAGANAAALITVSSALKDVLVNLGVPTGKITVLRNGVDLEFFRPLDRVVVRDKLGMVGKNIISVGNLVELKGHNLVIEALREMPDITLWILGGGPEEHRLKKIAVDCAVSDRVNFVGVVPQSELPTYYSAADALVLASSREGWANVLLESMACGTPVIATAVGGTPEIVTEPAAGIIVNERTDRALVHACQQLFAAYPDRALTRRFAEAFDWNETSEGQFKLFSDIARDRPPRGAE
ncbi:MAG: teichuronic acid biosynthesis glycosyltransferase TuaC [Gammaproteobacteria bacterium]